MTITELNLAIKLINENFTTDDYDFCSPITRETIISVEKILNLELPLSYKGFISALGCGDIKGSEINGIIKNEVFSEDHWGPIGSLNLVWLTLNDRKEYGLPEHILLIYSLGDGSYYALDVSQMDAEGECPVVYWPLDGYEATPKLEIVAKDFGEFFLNLIQDKIADKKKSTEA
ncbi:MAG: SMI1/KNR4 family protein [Alphaproteobacteria bacterium]|jgi:hypothetical protein|nr:SMI1/KNR4 family protein [Alphaproteobacteria bacterium]